MKKVAPYSKFVGDSTEIIRQSKIKGPLLIFKLQKEIFKQIQLPLTFSVLTLFKH